MMADDPSVARIKSNFDMVAFAKEKFNSEAIRQGSEYRIPNHGGLMINPDAQKWYDHNDKSGGDCFDLVGYVHFGTQWNRKDKALFSQILKEAADFAGVSLDPPKKAEIVALYDYKDAKGKVVYQAVRFDPKDFRQRRPDGAGGWEWKMEGVQRILYHLPELTTAPSSSLIFVVEGEKDVDNLAKLGLVATCNVGGAGKWRDEYSAYFKKHIVIILPDNDEAGKKHALEVARSAYKYAYAVRVINLPGLPEKGDVSDWLAAGGTKEKLLDMAAVAPGWAAASTNGHCNSDIISATSLLAKEFDPIKWAVPGLIPEGINMMAGRPKMGKSWLALGIAIAIGCGGRVLGQIKVEQGSVLYLGLEDSQRRLKDRLQKMLNGAAAPDKLDLTTECPRVGEGGIEYIETWLEKHDDARLVVIDTYIKIRQPRKANADIYDADYQAITAYRDIAEKYKVAVLLIHHTRKASADDPFDAILGTTGVGGSIDAGLILRRERGKSDATLSVAGRDTEEKEIALKWDVDLAQWTMLGDAEEFRMSLIKSAIINVLRKDGGSLSPKEVSDSIGDSIPGANANLIRWHMHQMSKDGELKLTERGRYAVLLSRLPNEPNALDEALESLKGVGGETWKPPF